jgi:hypothetical protein
MADDDIIQKISLLGAEDIRKELNALGAEGEAALKRLEEAGGGDLSKGVRALMPEVAKFDTAIKGAGDSAGKLPGIFDRIKSALSGLTGGSKPLASLGDDSTKAAKAGNLLKESMRGAGVDIRALGRATQLSGVSQFGFAMALAGRNAQLLILPAAIASIERIASSAAHAAAGFADMAAAAEQTPKNFAKFADVVIAAGGSFDDAGKAAKTFEANIKSAAASAESSAKGIEAASEALDAANSSYLETARGVDVLAQSQNAERIQLLQSKAPLESWNALNRKAAQESENLGRALLKAGDAAEKAQRALDKARQVTTPLEDAFRKVGVTLTKAFEKLPINEQLLRTADGFKNLGPEVDKAKLAVQIFGEEMGRKFLPALKDGEKGVKDFLAEGERIRPTFKDAQIEVGDKLVQAIGKSTSALASLRDALGLAISPTFTEFFTKVADLFVQIRPAVMKFGEALGPSLKPFLDGLVTVFEILITVGKEVISLFDKLAEWINKAFGGNITGMQIFVALILGLVGALAPVIPLILLVATLTKKWIDILVKIDWAKTFKPLTDFWDDLAKKVSSVWTAIVEDAKGVGKFFSDLWNKVATSISDAFNTSIEFIKGLWNSLVDTVKGWASAARDYVQSVIDKIKSLASALSGLGGGSGDAEAVAAGTAPGMAGGGSVRGPGSGRSDSILARLSNGEFVVQAAAVQKYGTQFLHAINSMSLSSRAVPGFNMGGLVNALAPLRAVPAYARGGSVTGGPQSIINLTIGQEAFFGLRAPEDTAAKLTKFARRQSANSAGKKPSWFGG